MSKSRSWTDDQLINAVKTSLSYAEVIRKLGLVPAGGNYDFIKRKIAELKLDTSHMTGKAWNQESRYRNINPKQELSKILVEHSTYVNTNSLRQRLLSEHVKEPKCECCGNTEWMGNLFLLSYTM